MFELMSSRPRGNGFSRRGFLKVGCLGATGLTLGDLLRAQGAAPGRRARSPCDRSVILIWLDGGPPQHETYDPKPDAPAEFRGPLKAISTAVPGVQVSELLPEHARLMDKMSIIRSMHHDNGDHFAAAHWMLTGYLGSNAIEPAASVSVGRVDHRQAARRQGNQGCRPTSACPPPTRSGSCPAITARPILGVGYNPFSADGDPNSEATRFRTWRCRPASTDRVHRAAAACWGRSTAPGATSTPRA